MSTKFLTVQERVTVRAINAHSGIFKTRGVMQKYLAAALNAPVTVRENAGEGGAWGMAVLAMYALSGKHKALEAYLDEDVFADEKPSPCRPNPRWLRALPPICSATSRDSKSFKPPSLPSKK
jgi:sugar (pentulose or hexulose) kinase